MRKEAVVAENVLRVDAAELDRVRVICQHCQVAIESSLAELGHALADGACRFCHQRLIKSSAGVSDDLMRFQGALQTVKDLFSTVRIEFVVKPPITG